MYDFYIEDDNFRDQKHRIPMSSFFSDVIFNAEALHAVHLHAFQNKAPVYLYRFGFQGQWSYVELLDKEKKDYGGVAHLDDVRYFMRCVSLKCGMQSMYTLCTNARNLLQNAIQDQHNW